MEIDLQPLKVIAGWQVEWNTFYEVDPSAENMHFFEGSSLLHLNNPRRKRGINLEWRPENDENGEFILRVLNLTATYNAKYNEIEFSADWEHPFKEIRTNNRLEIVKQLEYLMLTVPIFKG
jgi:hypothetical protein